MFAERRLGPRTDPCGIPSDDDFQVGVSEKSIKIQKSIEGIPETCMKVEKRDWRYTRN